MTNGNTATIRTLVRNEFELITEDQSEEAAAEQIGNLLRRLWSEIPTLTIAEVREALDAVEWEAIEGVLISVKALEIFERAEQHPDYPGSNLTFKDAVELLGADDEHVVELADLVAASKR